MSDKQKKRHPWIKLYVQFNGDRQLMLDATAKALDEWLLTSRYAGGIGTEHVPTSPDRVPSEMQPRHDHRYSNWCAVVRATGISWKAWKLLVRANPAGCTLAEARAEAALQPEAGAPNAGER